MIAGILLTVRAVMVQRRNWGKILPLSRGGSSAGRAPRSQCGGRGFDPLPLHQDSPPEIKRPLVERPFVQLALRYFVPGVAAPVPLLVPVDEPLPMPVLPAPVLPALPGVVGVVVV